MACFDIFVYKFTFLRIITINVVENVVMTSENEVLHVYATISICGHVTDEINSLTREIVISLVGSSAIEQNFRVDIVRSQEKR